LENESYYYYFVSPTFPASECDSERASDEADITEARFGVGREHHTGTGAVRPHHLLHTDRERHREMIKLHVLAVGDGAVGEQRRNAALARVEQLLDATHVEIALLLAGEAGGWQIFSGRTTTSTFTLYSCSSRR